MSWKYGNDGYQAMPCSYRKPCDERDYQNEISPRYNKYNTMNYGSPFRYNNVGMTKKVWRHRHNSVSVPTWRPEKANGMAQWVRHSKSDIPGDVNNMQQNIPRLSPEDSKQTSWKYGQKDLFRMPWEQRNQDVLITSWEDQKALIDGSWKVQRSSGSFQCEGKLVRNNQEHDLRPQPTVIVNHRRDCHKKQVSVNKSMPALGLQHRSIRSRRSVSMQAVKEEWNREMSPGHSKHDVNSIGRGLKSKETIFIKRVHKLLRMVKNSNMPVNVAVQQLLDSPYGIQFVKALLSMTMQDSKSKENLEYNLDFLLENAEKKSDWFGIRVTGNVKNFEWNISVLKHLSHLDLQNNSLSVVPAEIQQLKGLSYLNLAYNKLKEVPPEMGALLRLRILNLSNNFLKGLPVEMGRLFFLEVLDLSGNPLEKTISDLYKCGVGQTDLIAYLNEKMTFDASDPPYRLWAEFEPCPEDDKPTCTFSVMSYNILCRRYATKDMYPYCPQWALDWDYRKRGILDEICHYKADIITLQELSLHEFDTCFMPTLQRAGYEGIFTPKSRYHTMSLKVRNYVDGCAIFYSKSKFCGGKHFIIELNQLAAANSCGSMNMLHRVIPKDNVAIALLLTTKPEAWKNSESLQSHQLSQPILVSTAHLHWDPQFSDVKIIQTMLLLKNLAEIVDEIRLSVHNKYYRDCKPLRGCEIPLPFETIPLILCGDFNSLPESAVIEYLTNSRISAQHPDFKGLNYSSCLNSIATSTSNRQEYEHPFSLSTGYSRSIMPYTNYTYKFKGIIDYVFCSETSMTPLGVLGPIPEDWLEKNLVTGCPHPHIPSDHFSLMMEIAMTPTLPSVPIQN